MNFVERWLGFSPDGGSGSFEASAILVAVFVICVLVFRSRYQTARYRRILNVAEPK